MSKLETQIETQIKDLKKEELRLFNVYNRHANAYTKLEVLNTLVTVITKIETLETLKTK